MNRERKLKVVVVDDETIVLDVIRRHLEARGCEIKSAEGAFEAFSLLADVNPDMWIIDIKIPGIDGMSLAERIKSSDPTVVILLMSGYIDDEIQRKVTDLEGVKFMEKPIDFGLLSEFVKKAEIH